MFKLENKPVLLSGKDLIGHSAQIYLCNGHSEESILYPYTYIITVDNGVGTIEVPAKSERFYTIGDMTQIINYENSYYIIL